MNIERKATHRCTTCGALWILWMKDAHNEARWLLLDSAQKPGACCDNVRMGEQIVPIALTPPAG